MSSIIKNVLTYCRTQSWNLGMLLILLVGLSIPQTSHFVTRVRNTSYDFYQRIQPRIYQPAPVKIIAIDNESLDKIGQFPWSRLKVAELIAKLNALGAKVIAFDMLFSEPDRTSPKQLTQLFSQYPNLRQQFEKLPDNDDILADTIKQANVVTSFMLSASYKNHRLPEAKAGVMIQSILPFPALNCLYPNGTTLKKIEQAAQGNGTVAYVADEDGVIRNAPLFLCVKDEDSPDQYRLSPSISLEAVRLFKQQQIYKVYTEANADIERVQLGNDLIFQPNAKANIWLHYTHELASRYIPAWQVFTGKIDKEVINGHIVFIGVTASNLFDMRFNPFGRIIPGVEVHAQLTEQLLQHSYLHELPLEHTWLKLVVIAIWLFFYFVHQKMNGIRFSLILLSIVSLIVSICWWSFTNLALLIDPLLPSFSAIFLFFVFFIQKQLKTEHEKRWLRTAFGRYISPNRVKFLIDHPDSLNLGGEYRECTFVMTDLAGFTSLMEKYPPHECVAMLNNYLEGMIQIAFKYHGTLDRIVGDAVAVIFSAPLAQENHRQLALQCALEMDAYATQFATDKSEHGIQFGITRIGICTGKVLVGNFGGKTMLDYRALGDPINTASRLESVNKQFGTRLCVAESTLAQCEEFKARPIGDLVLKGKSETIKAFELLSTEQFASPMIQDYLKAYQQLESQTPDVFSVFAQLVEKYPNDALSLFHYHRLKHRTTEHITNNQDSDSMIILKDK